MRRVKFIGWLVLLMMIVSDCEELSAQRVVRYPIISYNVENLFDTINAPATFDEDMLPLADRQWNSEKYQAKLRLLARVISDMGCDGELPSIVALQEVENRSVLDDLLAEKSLSKASYGICHFESDDERGIDVALLYRSDHFVVDSTQAIRVEVLPDYDFRTRDILVVRGRFCREDFMFVVVHWPSRIEGVKFTEPWRITCAQEVRRIVDSAMAESPHLKVVVMGDMNDNPTNRSLRVGLRARANHRSLAEGDLYNPFARKMGKGSSVYDGRWNHYDNIILSSNLLHGNQSHLQLDMKQGRKGRFSTGVFYRKYMCGKRSYPLPTYKGLEYLGGASDHFPVYVILSREE